MTVTDNESEPSLPPTPSSTKSPDTAGHQPSRQVQAKSEEDMAAASTVSGAGADGGLPPNNPNNHNDSHQNGDNGQPSKRTLQNRKAQREFRERKASYVKSLEQRIRAYENNEIQGNVELQRAARRLKEENDNLREQLRQTQEQLTIYGSHGHVSVSQNRTSPRGPRGGAPQNAQPPQSLYSQPQGFSNDVSAYEVMGQAPNFQANNPPGYPQYFPQQQHYNAYPQHPQNMYGQEQSGDPSLNPELRRTPGRGGDNQPGRQQ